MENLGYYNGKIGLIQDMMVPMNDRVSYFGDGVYDATYAKNQVPFALMDHIDRFYRSASLIEIPLSMSKEEMAALLTDLTKKVDDNETMVYWQVTRGTGMRGHAYSGASTGPNFWVTVRHNPMRDIYAKYKLITLEDTRFFHCNIKTLNLLPAVIASQRAQEAKCDEAVFHRGEMVTECAHSNIHILKDGVFRTAPLSNLILAGITRMHLIQIAKEKGIPVQEEAFTVSQMMDADEVIFTSAGALCCSVKEIDGKPVGGKAPELLKTLQDAYLARFNAEIKAGK
jgi:D-alanine transaminase